MIPNKIFFFFIILLFQIYSINSSEVKIVTKVNSEILTNIDIENESKYLIILNTNLESLRKDRNVSIEEVVVAEEKVVFKLPKELN